MTTKTAVLQAIRQKCLDCSGNQPAEVRECPVYTCDLWPLRLGLDPDPSRMRGFANLSCTRTVLRSRGALRREDGHTGNDEG